MKGWIVLLSLLFLGGMAGASTQEEFEVWLETDVTDKHVYDTETYSCIQFADSLIINATDAGHDVYMVGLFRQDMPGHAIVSVIFDNGDVGFYEPRSDAELTEYLIEYCPTDNMIIFHSGYEILGITSVSILLPYWEGTITEGWTECKWP